MTLGLAFEASTSLFGQGKNNKHKELGWTPSLLDRNHPVDLSGPYRAMRAAMRCVLNTERAMRCDAKIWRCAFSLQKSSAMRCRDAKTLAMRCRDAGHSAVDMSHLSRGNVPSVPRTCCPIHVEVHTNQVRTSRMSWHLPPNHPRDTSKAYRPPNSSNIQEPKKAWNGYVQTNVCTNNSEQREGTTHENMGFSTQKGPENSSERRHERCHGVCITMLSAPSIYVFVLFIGFSSPCSCLHYHWETKGRFHKGRFWRMCPRSGFRSGGTCERTLVAGFRSGGASEYTLILVFVPGEHLPNVNLQH